MKKLYIKIGLFLSLGPSVSVWAGWKDDVLKNYNGNHFVKVAELLELKSKSGFSVGEEEGFVDIFNESFVNFYVWTSSNNIQPISYSQASKFYENISRSTHLSKKISEYQTISSNLKKIFEIKKQSSLLSLVSFNKNFCNKNLQRTLSCLRFNRELFYNKKIPSSEKKDLLRKIIFYGEHFRASYESNDLFAYIKKYPKDKWSRTAYRRLKSLYAKESLSAGGRSVKYSAEQSLNLKKAKELIDKK